MTTPFRVWMIAFAGCVILVLASIRSVDHPLADFLELHFRHTYGWTLADRTLVPLKGVVLVALLFLFYAGACLIAGRPLRSWLSKPLIFSCASVWALATEYVLKQIFGRAWPEPTYIQNHLDGFRFFHASDQWMAFPSGHAMNSLALATVAWQLIPRWRMPIMALAVTISGSMVLCNFHWLSDVVAGAFLGVTIGWMTVLLAARRA